MEAYIEKVSTNSITISANTITLTICREQLPSDTFVTQNDLAADLNSFTVLPSVGVN